MRTPGWICLVAALVWGLALSLSATPARGEPYRLVNAWPQLPANLELGQASAFSVLVILLVYAAVLLASLAMRWLNAGNLGQAGTLLGG